MATDNIAGHTAAQNTLGEDGLRDGDSLSPTTLTNLIQGVQGNGILRYQDGAYGSTRNETNSGNQPGSMVRASASTLTVSGGFAVLDGALYEFGTGVGNTITLDLNNASHGSGALTLAANEEAIYTIYVAPSGGLNKVYYEGGSPVDTTTNLYPSASNQYLINYKTLSLGDNAKTIVLAHVRVQYIASGGGSRNLNIVEINDKRVFVEGSADYRVPLSLGSITSGEIVDTGAQGVNTIAHLNAIHNDNGELTTSDTVNAHWVSHPRYGTFDQAPPGSGDPGYGHGPSRGEDRGTTHAADSFYFAGRNNEQTGHYSVRLQGRGVDATSTALTTNGTWVLTAEGDSFLMLSPNSGVTITLNPERDGSANYKFPEGHIIEVCNDGAGDIVFDNQTSPSGLNTTLNSGHRATFIYEGTVWVRCDYQSAIIANAPAIEISGGAPAFATGITQAEMLTLLGVEAGATADQTDAEIVAAVEGESTLDLTGQVTMAQDLKVAGVQYQQFKDLTDDLATGYHTIALIEGQSGGSASGTGGQNQRGIGTFLIRNTDSSRHQTIMLTASHLFGGGNGNGISVEHSSYFSTLGINAFRIKEASTYDGAALQMNIADATNNIEVYLKNNFQESGWQLIQAVADATDPSTASLGLGYNNAYSTFTASATTSISDIASLGQHIQGPLVCKNDVTIGDDLNHDGSNVGFFGTTPTTKTAVADVGAFTAMGAVAVPTPAIPPVPANDTADDTVLAISTLDSNVTQLKTDLDTLRTKVNDLLDALQAYGLV